LESEIREIRDSTHRKALHLPGLQADQLGTDPMLPDYAQQF
jgi:hypothetical protein